MMKRMIIMLLLLILVFGGIFGFKAYTGYMMGKKMAARGMPPQTVSTMVAHQQIWQTTLKAVGTLRAARGADLAADVSGIVSVIHFMQGQYVQKGTLLVQLDAGSDLARLQSLKAAAMLAATTYRRDKAQFQVQAISQQSLDTSHANLKQARANVEEQQALVDKKSIRAPFSGRLGIRNVDLGQYLKAGDAMVTLQQLDPMYLDFYLPQQALRSIRVGQKAWMTVDTYPDERFSGHISVINPQVDAATRNVKIRARLKNSDHKLLPGMYASVKITSGKAHHYITLPQTAISFNPYGNIIYRVEHKGKDQHGKLKKIVKQVFVTTGDTRGDQVAIVQGIDEGDVVVTSGQIKLHNGIPIKINNTIQPHNDAHPTPQDE